MKRRKFILQSALTGLTVSVLNRTTSQLDHKTKPQSTRYQNGRSPWPICLDTATIRTAGTLNKKVDIAFKAGYDAVEPWDGELRDYEESKGKLQ